MLLLRSAKASTFVLATSVLLGACGGYLRPATGAAASMSAEGSTTLRVYETKSGRFVPFSRLVQAMNGVDVVFFGEQHDDPATHAAELAVLAALGERHERVVLTLEMFERDVQSVLDQYLAGTISEKDFLAGSRPWDRYTTDYRGMVELARVRGWPVIAGNVPRRLASAVSRAGLTVLDTMNAKDRAFVARENLCPKDLYYQKFVETMSGMSASHGGSATAAPTTAGATPTATTPRPATPAAGSAPSVDRIYQAQCVKDETMGEAVANALPLAGRNGVVLQVDGAFHSDFGLGTAERTRRRAPSARTLVLTAVPVAELKSANGAEHATRGDFVLFTRAPVKDGAK